MANAGWSIRPEHSPIACRSAPLLGMSISAGGKQTPASATPAQTEGFDSIQTEQKSQGAFITRATIPGISAWMKGITSAIVAPIFFMAEAAIGLE
jgi:hypothetical protein